MNLSTMKWAQWDKSPIQRTVSLFICVCIALCTIVAHNIAQNRPDNFPSYPLDNHRDRYRDRSLCVSLEWTRGLVFACSLNELTVLHPTSHTPLHKTRLLSSASFVCHSSTLPLHINCFHSTDCWTPAYRSLFHGLPVASPGSGATGTKRLSRIKWHGPCSRDWTTAAAVTESIYEYINEYRTLLSPRQPLIGSSFLLLLFCRLSSSIDSRRLSRLFS